VQIELLTLLNINLEINNDIKMNKGNPNYKRVKSERKADKKIIVVMRNEGKTFREITEWINKNRTYNLSHIQVYNDFNNAIKESVSEINLNEELQKQLRFIDFQIEELLDSWFKSKGLTKIKTQKISKGNKESKNPKNTKQELFEKSFNSPGDVSFMNSINSIYARRDKLLGMNAAIKVSGDGDNPIKHEHKFQNLTLEEKIALDNLLAKTESGNNA